MCLLLMNAQSHRCHTGEVKNAMVEFRGEGIPFVSSLLKAALLLLLKTALEDHLRCSFQ